MESNTGKKSTWCVTKRTVLSDRALMTYSCYKELCKAVHNQIVIQSASAEYDPYIEETCGCMGINSTERIVKKIDVCILVQCTSKLDALLLTTTKIYSSLPNLSTISIWQHFKVLDQRAPHECVVVSFPVHRRSKENIVLHSSCLDPCILRNICYFPTDLDLKCLCNDHEVDINLL